MANDVGPDIYTFGGHAGGIYNAEVVKTVFFAPAIKSGVPSNPAPISLVTARPQDTPNQTPSWTQAALIKGVLPSTIQFFVGRPQDDPSQIKNLFYQGAAQPASYTLLGTYLKGTPQTDPTQPPAVITPKASGGGLPANPSIKFVQGAPQVDLTPASSVMAAIPNPPVISGRLTAQQLFTPAQADPSQMQPIFFSIQYQIFGTTLIGNDRRVWGTHAATLYNAEAEKSDFWAPMVQGAAQSGVLGSQYLFGAHAAVVYTAEAQKTVLWQAVAPRPLLPGSLLAQEYIFGTHAVAVYNAEAAKTTFFPYPVITGQGNIIQYHEAGPQVADYSIPSPTFASSLSQPPNSVQLSLRFSGPQQVDLTIQPQVRGPTFTTPPVAFSPAKMFMGGPRSDQVVSTQLPAQVWHPSMNIPPAVLQLRTITAGPQIVDLTIQPRVMRQSFAVPLPFVVPLQTITAWPQIYDFTPETEPRFFQIGIVPFVIGTLITVPRWGGRVVLSPKKLGEKVLLPVDFISRLGVGETIISANVSCSLYSGTDPNASSMPIGPPVVIGSVVEQYVQNGVIGTTYELLYSIVTSAGQNLALSGYFTVVPDLP